MKNFIFEFRVQNIKCNGCANAIKSGLTKDSRVKEVRVDIPQGLVTVVSHEEIRADLSRSLTVLGFPERTA